MSSWSSCARLCLRAVDGRCGRLMVILCGVSFVVHSLCLWAFVAIHACGWSLVVIGGDCCGCWLPCVSVGGGPCVVVECSWLGVVIVVHHLLMVVVRRKEGMSYIVTRASCLNIHMRSHVNDLCILISQSHMRIIH